MNLPGSESSLSVGAPRRLDSESTDLHGFNSDRASFEQTDGLWCTNIKFLIPGLTHEVMGPFVAIISGIDFMLREADFPERVVEVMHEMRDAARRGWLTVETMRAVASPSINQDFYPNPRKCMRRVLEILEFQFRKRNVTVTLRDEPQPGSVRVAESVLLHLLTGAALLALDEAERDGNGGRVDISIRGSTGTICVETDWSVQLLGPNGDSQPDNNANWFDGDRAAMLRSLADADGSGEISIESPSSHVLQINLPSN